MKAKYRNYYQNRDLQIAIAVFLAGLSCFGLLYYYQVLLPDLVEHFKISKAESSFAVSFATFGMAVGLVTAMFVADRYSRKHVIGFSLFASAILAFASSFSENFSILIFLNFIKGFLLAGSTSVCLTYISEEVSEHKKLKITGFYIGGNAIGGLFGRVLASKIAHFFSWQIASEIIGIWCLLCAILFFVVAPKSQHFHPKKESFRTLIKPNLKLIFNKNLLPYYFTGFLLLGTFVSLYNYMAFFLVKPPFQIPEFWIPYVYVLYLTGVLGSLNVHFWEKKLGNSIKILQAMSILGIFGFLTIFIENKIFVILGVGIFTYAFFVAHTVCSKMVGEFSKEKKSVTIAIYLLLYYVGSSILGSSTGIILQNFNWQIFLMVLMLLFGIIFLIFSLKQSNL